jgi:hypothetical protein
LGAHAHNLSLSGFGAKGATTGAGVLRLARKLRPNLILLDIMLPGESGIDVCGCIPAIGHVPSLGVVIGFQVRISENNPPRTTVNKGKKEGRSVIGPGPRLCLSRYLLPALR